MLPRMSESGEKPCAEGIEDRTEQVTDLGTRSRALSRKGLQNAVEQKRHEVDILHGKLQRVIRSVEGFDDSHCFDNVLSELVTLAEKFRVTLQELQSLYEQDKFEVYKGETSVTNEYLTLNHAHVLIDKVKIKQSNKQLETHSRHSRRSKSISSSSTTSSAARMRALAEAAAARKSAEYELVIAEREHTRRERADYEKDLAILAANRKVAVANAKLKAIERAIEEKEIEIRCEIPEIPKVKSEVRTQDWVRANSVTQHPPQESKVPVPQHNNAPRKRSETPRVNTAATATLSSPLVGYSLFNPDQRNFSQLSNSNASILQ